MVRINDKLLKRAIGHLGRTRLRPSSATPLEKPAGDWFKPDFKDAGWKEGKGGFGTFAPPLDAAGNSVKGQLAAKFLSQRLGMDLFVSNAEP